MKYFILASLLCFTSCMTETELLSGSALSADYNHAKQNVVINSDVKYIPLETTPSSLIASIDKFLYNDTGLLYILDKEQGSILIFNKEGKFVSSIKKSGEGPGEYVKLIDMDVDKNGSLHEAIQIVSDKYIPYSELKKMENNVPNFIQDNKHIKDLISIYETDSLFMCMPYIKPSDEYMFIPKSDASKSFRVRLTTQPKLSGISLPVIGVINNYFVASMNSSEANKKLTPKVDDNPTLVLFTVAGKEKVTTK